MFLKIVFSIVIIFLVGLLGEAALARIITGWILDNSAGAFESCTARALCETDLMGDLRDYDVIRLGADQRRGGGLGGHTHTHTVLFLPAATIPATTSAVNKVLQVLFAQGND